MRLPRPLDGLAFRIALLLTVALFPIGLIAVSLTQQVADSTARREEGAILALTAEAAASEESMMSAARTVVRALVMALPTLRGNPGECSAVFNSFVHGAGQYSFAAYIDAQGTILCGSDRVGEDVSGSEIARSMAERPEPRIDMRLRGTAVEQSVFVFLEPVRDAAGQYDGYVALSLPNNRSFRRVEQLPDSRPLTFLTFNDQGTVLAANVPLDTIKDFLPQGRPLGQFVGGPRRTFPATSQNGEERFFAVVPILPGQLYALGSWPQRPTGLTLEAAAVTPLLFVSVMWMVSLGVAYLAVHRLAIRNIVGLRQRMNRFIATRQIDRVKSDVLAQPLEFREVGRTWEELAETVVRDEAELENIIHGRTVLLKEVHHRVKNNLQLIASIVSMKIRKASTPEARVALKEVQMRVMSIATVHQALYTTSTMGQVRADTMLKGIVDKIIEAGIQPTGAFRVETAWDEVELYPDQAVPLSLLASEAVTNALKYVGRPATGTPWLKVELRRISADAAEIIVSNSRGTPLLPPEQSRGTGLGMNLIRAFALQMRGSAHIGDEDPQAFTVRVEFRVIAFDHIPQAGVELDHPDWSKGPASSGAAPGNGHQSASGAAAGSGSGPDQGPDKASGDGPAGVPAAVIASSQP